MMKRIAALVFVLLLVTAGTAFADQDVQLKGTRYTLTLPDSMEYDGPGKPGRADFAYVSYSLGLEVRFVSGDGSNIKKLGDMESFIEDKPGVDDVQITVVNGIEMIAYRITVSNPEGKAIGYILRDGDTVWQIEFWYTNQTAADMTKTIMESIQ